MRSTGTSMKLTHLLLTLSLVGNALLLFSNFIFPSSSSLAARRGDLSEASSSEVKNHDESRVVCPPISTNNTTVSHVQQGYVPYERVFGHVHMAKSAGTEINGELAAHFERVCGHKGYSYDAVQYNERVAKSIEATGATSVREVGGSDLISKQYEGFSRGRVINNLMVEIGFEDCDYISLEAKWDNWEKIAPGIGPLELHIPCRDPLSHLMSQCNYKHRVFDCESKDLQEDVRKCLVDSTRFNLKLQRIPNATLRCFNPVPIDPYIEYMGQFLQRRRIETNYIHRETNTARNKDEECIWKDAKVAERVLKILLENHDYYSWCDKCMGSENDIFGR